MNELDKEIQNGTHHEYVKNKMMQNDKKWFILYLIICSIFIGAIVHEMENVKVIDNTPVVKYYCDSLQNFVDTSLDYSIEPKKIR